MMTDLLNALQHAADAIGKPGRAVRGALAGNGREAMSFVPFSDSIGLTDQSEAVSGSALLQALAGVDPDSAAGVLGGMGVEMALDPLNLVGGGFAARSATRGIGEYRAAEAAAASANARRAEMIAKGAMPADVAAATKIVDEAGKPLRTYHGTEAVYDKYDPALGGANGDLLYGPGYYTTADPGIASEYALKTPDPVTAAAYTAAGMANKPSAKALSRPRNVRTQYLDIRNPFSMDAMYEADEVERLAKMAEGVGLPADSLSDMLWQTTKGARMRRPEKGDSLWDMVRDHFTVEEDLDPDGLLHQAAGAKANEWLRAAGFDGISHIGGRNIGTREHQVHIAFDPSQIYRPWVAPPAAAGPDAAEIGRLAAPSGALLAAMNAYNAGMMGNSLHKRGLA